MGLGSSSYVYPDAGVSHVTVADGGKRLSLTIAMTGSIGELVATGEMTRS